MDKDEFYQDKTSVGEEINYEELMPQKNNRRSWSVAALVLSVFSVLCCPLPVLGIILGAFALVFVVVSRISLGYFDKISVGALILGVFGVVFGVCAIVAFSNPEINKMLDELLKNQQN